VRIDAGAGVGVRAHDDLVISLGMAAVETAMMQRPRLAFGFARMDGL
jgi:hypothetical protein